MNLPAIFYREPTYPERLRSNNEGVGRAAHGFTNGPTVSVLYSRWGTGFSDLQIGMNETGTAIALICGGDNIQFVELADDHGTVIRELLSPGHVQVFAFPLDPREDRGDDSEQAQRYFEDMTTRYMTPAGERRRWWRTFRYYLGGWHRSYWRRRAFGQLLRFRYVSYP